MSVSFLAAAANSTAMPQPYFYPGFGDWAKNGMHFAQAMRVGDHIVCSAQGGWDPNRSNYTLDDIIQVDLKEEIHQAFANVDHNLKYAGGKGWSQVYRVVTYSTDVPKHQEYIINNFKEWMPDHYPTWNVVGVTSLGSTKMHVEIEVQAYDPEGAAAEAAKKAQKKQSS